MKRTIIAFLIIVTLSVGCSGGTEITEKPVINEKPDVSPTDIPENHDPAEYLLFLTVPYYQRRYYRLESIKNNMPFFKDQFNFVLDVIFLQKCFTQSNSF